MMAEEYFKAVYERSSFNQKKSLDNLKAVCDYFDKEKLRIRVMAIGRVCKTKFGMTSENTLKANHVLKEYINLRATEQCFSNFRPTVDCCLNERIKYLELENKKLRKLLKITIFYF